MKKGTAGTAEKFDHPDFLGGTKAKMSLSFPNH